MMVCVCVCVMVCVMVCVCVCVCVVTAAVVVGCQRRVLQQLRDIELRRAHRRHEPRRHMQVAVGLPLLDHKRLQPPQRIAQRPCGPAAACGVLVAHAHS